MQSIPVPPTLMKHNCTHNPSVSQVSQNNHSNTAAFPYPPDPGEHVLERSVTSTALVKRDILDLSSLAPTKRGDGKFYLFKSPTSRTLCFGEPTLRKLTQVKLSCNHISSMLKNSSSPFILISSSQRSITLLAPLLFFIKIACLHVSFTAYENFYKLSKMHCLLIVFSTFFPSEVSESRNSTIKHIITYTLFHPSISTYVVDHFLVISCP